MAYDPETSYQSWFQTSWRPAMAYQYLIICMFDFMVAPIMMGFYSAYTGEYHAWDPLTIRGSSMYHVAMGAILGVTVWSRSQEKMQVLNSNGTGEEKEKCDPDKINDRANDEGGRS